MPISISGTNGVTLSGQFDSASSFGFKNRIINGAMVIDQRNAGASVTPTTNGTYTLDRFKFFITQASKFSTQQNAGSVTPPTGYKNYLGVTSLSAYSVISSDYFSLVQCIEDKNFADFAWGTASPSSATISFWVRSSLTGTFGASLTNYTGSRSYPFTYSISSANTWEQKSVTIAGDTDSSWTTTSGLNLCFGLGVGSTASGTAGAWASANYLSATGATSVVGTNGATFYITGVQLEKGSTATSFDYRPYTTELQLCRRYLPVADSSATVMYYAGQCVTNAGYIPIIHDVVARVPPTGITLSASASSYQVTNSAATQLACTAVTFNSGGVNSSMIQFNVSSGLTAGNATLFNLNGQKIFFTGCEL